MEAVECFPHGGREIDRAASPRRRDHPRQGAVPGIGTDRDLERHAPSPSSRKAASNTRLAASKRISCLKILPTAVTGIDSRMITSLGTAARSGIAALACRSSSSARCALARPQHHVNDRQLAGVRVRLADRGGHLHGRMPHHRFLDHGRVDVVAAADDQVLLPAGQPEATVGVLPRQVAGVASQPSPIQMPRLARSSL